jgi:hypothetical protein
MTRKRISVLAGAAVLAMAGLGTGVALAGCGSPGQPAAATSAAAPGAPASPATPAGPDYSWYRSMMGGYYGSGRGMMGGSSYGWMMSQAGYQWMTGGTGAPGWMRGESHSPACGVKAASRVAVMRPAASPASSRPAAVSSAAACMRL